MTRTMTPTTTTTGRTLRVHVQADRCQGHNRCKAIAPELFELDELGNARAAGEGIVPEGLAEKARLAQANCPEFAITIRDGDRESAP